jgi:hypothetical protein
MRTLSHASASPLFAGRPVARWNWRLPYVVKIFAAAAAIVVAMGLLFYAHPPGAAIRGDLVSGAAAVQALPANARPARVAKDVREAMRGRAVRVDPTGFPTAVAVTLLDIDWRNCVAAEQAARRIEGKVVVQLQGYAASEDCRTSNDMTWRFMP